MTPSNPVQSSQPSSELDHFDDSQKLRIALAQREMAEARITELEDAERKAAKHIRGLERTITLAAEHLQKHAARRTMMLSQSSWMPKRSTVEADRNEFVSVENTLRAALSHAGPVARDGEQK